MADKPWQALRDNLKANPRNRSFGDVEQLLLAAGFEASQGKGSHVNFRKPGFRTIVTVTTNYRGGLPIGYVKSAVRAVDESNDVDEGME